VKISELPKKSISPIKANPYIWFLVILAVFSDIWAILTYNPNSPDIPYLIIWVSIIPFIAETSVFYALLRHVDDAPSSFVDALMTALTSINTLGAKAIMMIIPSFYFVLFFLGSAILNVFLDDILVPILYVLLLLPLLWLLQIWTPYAAGGLLVQQYSVFESISHAWRIIWENKKTLAKIVLFFVIVDMLLISVLYLTGGISFKSAFIYTVTEEMAKMNVQFMTGSPAQAGEYFAINRPVGGLLATTLKGRGIDLLSISTFIISKKLYGLVTVVATMILLPIRLSVLAITYNEWAEPTHEFNKEEAEYWKNQKSLTKSTS